MEVRIFRAANLQTALEEIREQLGPHASVLETRQCREGFMGWLGRSYVEVTASASEVEDADLQSIPFHREPNTHSFVDGKERLIDSRRPGPPSGNDRYFVNQTSPTRPAANLPLSVDDLTDQFTQLISLGVQPEVAERWIRATAGFVSNLGDRLEGPWVAPSWQEQLQRTVSREIHLGSPIQLNPGERRVVALIGPTGVGKTTTVAKLAAGFRQQSKRRVGLLTIDTFRIAAVQQLQAYSQIMDLPMVVVESATQMRRAIDDLGDVDLILIDTAGRSPRGDTRVEGMAELLRTAQPDETHLVISATSTAAFAQSTIEGFSVARPTATIITKLDESPYTAAILSAVTSTRAGRGLPISYLTNGQHVPEDIAIATAERLVARLLPKRIELPQMDAA